MRTDTSLLIVGHSHTECLRRALDTLPDAGNIRQINLRHFAEKGIKGREALDEVAKATDGFRPDALCLSVGGNEHNILGILENPVPFAIGDGNGAVPQPAAGRHFIPRALIEEYFDTRLPRFLIRGLYDLFPGAKRLYLNPPPPIPDFEHIRKHPGVFADNLELGAPPKELRMLLYRLQTESLRKFVAGLGATFIEPDPALLDDERFLAPQYFNTDPTHGNTAYGQVMLARTLDIAAGPP